MKYHLFLFHPPISSNLFVQTRANKLIKYVKSLTFLFSITFISISAFSQSHGIKWQRPIGGSLWEYIRTTITTSDGNILTVSETSSNNGDVTSTHGRNDIWVCKLTTDGRILWSKVLGSTKQDIFLNIHASTDGGYFLIMEPGANDGDVTGYHGLRDVWVVKLSSSGTVEWKRCIGGSKHDYYISSFMQTDGGITILGHTASNDGDFLANHGGTDIFICKVDNQGNVISSQIYGGSGNELFHSIIIKPNGNYIIYGFTLSNNTGQIGITKGSSDIMLMEISADGTFLWCKTYGGSQQEEPRSMIRVGFNKFALMAETTSSDGDMIGAHGGTDLWVAIVDSLGTIITNQILGGSSNEGSSRVFYSAVDSSVLIASSTNSSDGDISNYHGGSDIWLVKINNQGIVAWKKCLGGSGNESLTNCLLIGTKIFFLARTTSNNGDVSGNHGKTDFWTGLLNESGNLDWQKCLGGTEDDVAKSLITDSTHLFIAGDINSRDGDITGMHARSDTIIGDTSTSIIFYPDVWIASLSMSGTLNWQKALGGFHNEQLQNLILLGDDLLISALTESNNGDIFNTHGRSETWLVRLGLTNKIIGKVFFDKNLNGLMESDEGYFDDVIIESKKSNYNRSAIPYNGWFKNEVDTGNYTTSVVFNLPYYTSVPLSITSSFLDYFNTDSISFAIQPIPDKKDLVISAIPLSAARPGFNTTYRLFYKNIGTTTIASGEIIFIKDGRLTLTSSVPTISSSSGDTLKWNYSNFAPADTASITLQFNVQAPPATSIGDTLTSVVVITPVELDETPADDTAVIRHRVTGSFDPNDKYENNGGIIRPEHIINGDYLNYTIRFQNTGTDIAFTVVVRDTLDNRLEWGTLQMINASHAYNLSIIDGNKLTWTFFNIQLPDSNVNEPASHGFIAYRIIPKSTVVVGDTVHNTASIYFDFNLPVLTNNALTVVENNVVLPLKLLNFSGVYHNEQAVLHWSTAGEYDVEKFEIERSFNAGKFISVGGVLPRGGFNSTELYNFTDNLANIPVNTYYYRLKMTDKDGRIGYSQVLVIRKKTKTGNSISISPNPVTGTAQINITLSSTSLVEFQVIDMSGRIMLKQKITVFEGNNSIAINKIQNLQSGFYIMQAINGNDKLITRFVITK